MYRADQRWLFTDYKVPVIRKIATGVVRTAQARPESDTESACSPKTRP